MGTLLVVLRIGLRLHPPQNAVDDGLEGTQIPMVPSQIRTSNLPMPTLLLYQQHLYQIYKTNMPIYVRCPRLLINCPAPGHKAVNACLMVRHHHLYLPLSTPPRRNTIVRNTTVAEVSLLKILMKTTAILRNRDILAYPERHREHSIILKLCEHLLQIHRQMHLQILGHLQLSVCQCSLVTERRLAQSHTQVVHSQPL